MIQKTEILLSNEKLISKAELDERIQLYNLFSSFSEDFFAKLRHFQPQIGCLNACKICSKYASSNVSFWDETRQRNVIAALKKASMKYRTKKPYICWNRDNHRSGVIFSYLDNDIGNYYYLDNFIKLCYEELGVATRISTVGYSRHNRVLNHMHKQIVSTYSEYLGGVRLSFTPYAIGWSCENSHKFSKLEYIKDMANFLKIYKPYYLSVGSGNRKFCVELRYKPLAIVKKVYNFIYQEHMVIATGNYLYISQNTNIKLKETQVFDPNIETLSLTNPGEPFYQVEDYYECNSISDIINFIKNCKNLKKKNVDLYLFCNKEGIYYAINPCLNKDGNSGINIYPTTSRRNNSGYIVTERFFLNSLLRKKEEIGNQKYTWEDVNRVILDCKETSEKYLNQGYYEKYQYIKENIIPMIIAYVRALKLADYPPSVFFDKNFTIDTGIICNLGRGISEFNGLTKIENEPLTPTHEKNYGNKASKMMIEDVAWRLSCDYDNRILIEELNLKNTATKDGQINYQTKTNLKDKDECWTLKKLSINYLIPGQVPKNKIYFYKEKGELGFLASYSPHGFYDKGVYWKTLEHYYQANKFTDENIRKKIIEANTPKEASIIGRNRENKIIDNWEKKRLDVMMHGLYCKFNSNPMIKEKLLLTGNKEIIEATTKEKFWGCGINEDGENNYGKLLMQVREALRKEGK